MSNNSQHIIHSNCLALCLPSFDSVLLTTMDMGIFLCTPFLMLRFKTIRVYYFDMMLLNSDCVVFTECWQQEPSVPLVKGPSPPQSVYEVDMVSYAKLIYEHS